MFVYLFSITILITSHLSSNVRSELYYHDTPNHFPAYQLNSGLDTLKSASFNSFGRMLELLNSADAFNSQVDKYLKDKFKHNAFTKE
jgi:hypothetical protein